QGVRLNRLRSRASCAFRLRLDGSSLLIGLRSTGAPLRSPKTSASDRRFRRRHLSFRRAPMNSALRRYFHYSVSYFGNAEAVRSLKPTVAALALASSLLLLGPCAFGQNLSSGTL